MKRLARHPAPSDAFPTGQKRGPSNVLLSPSARRAALALFLFLQLRLDAGTLNVRIFDAHTNGPVIGANVTVLHTLLGGVTGADGTAVIERIPEGFVEIRVSMIGYRSLVVPDVSIGSKASMPVWIQLEPAPLSGDAVVVTSAKHPQELGSANQSVDVVGFASMGLRQSRNVEESLNAVSGVHFNEGNVSIRGSSGYSVFNVGSRVLLMVDGVPVLTSDLGAVNWKLLPLLDIDRIEVVKGAGSALYGSSAMGGVVNLITRSPEPGGRLLLRLSSGFYDSPHYAEWKWTDRTLHAERIDLSYGRRIGQVGLRFGASRNVSTGYMENNELDQWNVSGRLNWTLPNRSRFEFAASWMKSREGGFIQWINQNEPFKVPPFNQKDEIHYTMADVYAFFHWPLTPKFGLRVRASFLQSEIGNQLTAFKPGAFDPGRGPGFEVQADWFPCPLHQLTFGGEARWDLSGSQYFGKHHGYSVAPYVQEEWSFAPAWKASFGVRMDRHVLADEAEETRVSPKFGLNFRPSPTTTLRTSGGAGFRAATVFEKYIRADYSGFNIVPNPDLRSERSWTWDAGVRQSLFGNVQLDVSIFQSDYWDMIEPFVNFLGTIQFQNFIRARIRGVEGSAQSWWWKGRLGLEADWCWMDPADLNAGWDLPYRPRAFGTLIGTLKADRFTFQAEWRYARRIETVELNPLDPRVPVKLLHLRGQVEWGSVTFQASLNNALNYHYTQIERRMGEVRNANVTIIGKF